MALQARWRVHRAPGACRTRLAGADRNHLEPGLGAMGEPWNIIWPYLRKSGTYLGVAAQNIP